MQPETMMTPNGNIPWWIKAAKEWGIFALICAGLIWVFVVEMRTSIEAIHEGQQEAVGLMKSHMDATGRINVELLFFMRVNCQREAREHGENPDSCVPPRDLLP